MHKRAVQCLDCRLGIVSNNNRLIRDKTYFASARVESLLTDVKSYAEVPYEGVNAEFIVLDDPQMEPFVSIGEEACTCAGDISEWEEACSDLRYSVFGNLGLFFRYTLATLERYHGIYSLHASSVYIPDKNTLMIVIGGAGAGKTVYLLRAVEEDWKIFSTEMTHFRITKQGLSFFKGSLYDNVRLGSLIYDFPGVAGRLGIRIPQSDDPWESQITIDLRPMQAEESYLNPRVQIVLARIESNRDEADVRSIDRGDRLVRHLYKNASEKFAYPWLMYERIPVEGCDDRWLARTRLEIIREFIAKADLLPVKSILAGVKSCMDGLDL